MPDAYIGILIDRSGSMQGKKIELAKAFGALVAESARGIRGIEGNVLAFDDKTLYTLGGFPRNAVSALTAGGGNNDAGALYRAAEIALKSRRRNRLLVMISDGAPTECTFESLKNLVESLTRHHGILCAQAAVQPIKHIAFPHYVDLSSFQENMDEAVVRFAGMLMRLTVAWR